MRRVALILLGSGSPLLVLALLVGGRWAEWGFVLVSLSFPAALCAVGAMGPGRRATAGRLFLALGLLLVASGAGMLLLDGREGSLLGLPPAAALMLVGLGLVPLLLTCLGYAAGFGESGAGRPPLADRENEGRR